MTSVFVYHGFRVTLPMSLGAYWTWAVPLCFFEALAAGIGAHLAHRHVLGEALRDDRPGAMRVFVGYEACVLAIRLLYWVDLFFRIQNLILYWELIEGESNALYAGGWVVGQRPHLILITGAGA